MRSKDITGCGKLPISAASTLISHPSPAPLAVAEIVEKNLRWSLDVALSENESRVRERAAGTNIGVLRHAAFTQLK